ncbi:MAG TPA: hypothetical protein VG146_07685 [Verrucomicrobiae bacterium]|nr:hypothetical protein [Verrucomicrobiae bacterium]
MKNRIGLIILVLVCVGLAIGLFVSRKAASDQHSEDATKIDDLSNRWVQTRGKLEEQTQVAAMFEKDLDAQRKAIAELTNKFSLVSANLADTSSNLAKTEDALKASQQDVAQRDSKIVDLETQNQALDKQAADLSASLTNLTLQIADTQKKLNASEGDKAFLQNELTRMMAEKSELERQFNDLTVLRAQVSKLKDELNIARRIQWIRDGLFARAEQKGAQHLMQGFPGPTVMTAKSIKPAYDLNVEVGSDGSVKVIPPLGNRQQETNAAPAK